MGAAATLAGDGQPLRVGQFLSHYPAPGGSTTVLRGLASGLAELGHDVVAYGYGLGRESAGFLESVIFRQPRIRARMLAWAPVREHLAERIAANADRLDVLILHGMWSPDSIRLRRAARAARITCIAQPHDPYSPTALAPRHTKKAAYWSLVERPFLRSVDAIQIYAPSHRQHLERLGVSTPTLVVPAGLDRRALQEPSSARHDLETSEPIRLLFLGRFDIYNKGIDILLDAIAFDPTVRDGVRLELVGGRTATETSTVDALVAERGLAGIARVAPRRNDPWDLLRQADLLVLPSRFDGFAQVVTESLAVGTPAIVSREAGSSEYLDGSHGVLTIEPTVDDLRRALRQARSALPALRAAAARAHAYLQEELTWTACARRWLNELTNLGLAGEGRSGAPQPSAKVTG